MTDRWQFPTEIKHVGGPDGPIKTSTDGKFVAECGCILTQIFDQSDPDHETCEHGVQHSVLVHHVDDFGDGDVTLYQDVKWFRINERGEVVL